MPVGWLWLLAAASTALSSCVLGSWIPLRGFRIAFPSVMVVGGALLVVVCWSQGIGLAGALVLYSCAHIGLLLGLLPQRGMFKDILERWRGGEATDHIRPPRRHLAFFAVCLVGVLLAGFALTR
ncbi:hypothetical protein ACPCIX_02360 [Streptomyces pseudogriseolus]|uniref:hypothetical protein n=1 Tax=Streptomyces TaxID=1883 RepID=UPI00131C0E39|nr:hypothetical protein [Streptomyces sp. NRRL F-5527]